MFPRIYVIYVFMPLLVVRCQDVQNAKSYTDYFDGGHVIANVITNKSEAVIDCYIIGDVYQVRKILQVDLDTIPGSLDQVSVPEGFINHLWNVTKEEMIKIIDRCNRKIGDGKHEISIKSLKKLTVEQLGHLFIFPGTKWCGPGDIASDYDDLGPLEATDKCCRRHDQSSDSLDAGEMKHGLKNTSPYTMTRCQWDLEFSKCLANNKDFPSDVFGNLFFNVLKTRCFDFDYPATCTVKSLVVSGPCLGYTKNTTQKPIWQTFDATPYLSDLFPGEKIAEAIIFAMPGHNEISDIYNMFKGLIKS